jgi:hypothetical protein
MEKMNNEYDEKKELIKKILYNIERMYGKESFLYKTYSKPENQEKLTISKLKAIYEVQQSANIEKLSKEENIDKDISDFLNGKQSAKFYHIQKQE